ncbi:hypothetical protein M3202_19800 [Alkalihalobacillus oceani]|uniref:Uncharacterized protein n=1 Tax=Halalkalibacter oceani TaxID=1653776 RepID=A0A9X2DVI4_9BACI|nr:hypothetical protein [Halalkalibacter oceani]MCM3716292.1 hypothetical protein [Halalkalibacter oceani]
MLYIEDIEKIVRFFWGEEAAKAFLEMTNQVLNYSILGFQVKWVFLLLLVMIYLLTAVNFRRMLNKMVQVDQNILLAQLYTYKPSKRGDSYEIRLVDLSTNYSLPIGEPSPPLTAEIKFDNTFMRELKDISAPYRISTWDYMKKSYLGLKKYPIVSEDILDFIVKYKEVLDRISIQDLKDEELYKKYSFILTVLRACTEIAVNIDDARVMKKRYSQTLDTFALQQILKDSNVESQLTNVQASVFGHFIVYHEFFETQKLSHLFHMGSVDAWNDGLLYYTFPLKLFDGKNYFITLMMSPSINFDVSDVELRRKLRLRILKYKLFLNVKLMLTVLGKKLRLL